MTSERRGDDGLLFLVGVREKGISPFRGVYDPLPRFVIPANTGIQRGAGIEGKFFVHPKEPSAMAMVQQRVVPSESVNR